MLRLITSIIFWPFFFIRSCLNETQLCKGSALCPNKEDLKYCQNATSLGLTDTNWEPINSYYVVKKNKTKRVRGTQSCNNLGQPDEEKKLQGQQINPLNVNDNQFHCWNRKDEQPFDVAKTTNGTNDGNQKTWLDNVEKPCESIYHRRCLGDRADQCVHSRGNFLTLNENNGPGQLSIHLSPPYSILFKTKFSVTFLFFFNSY